MSDFQSISIERLGDGVVGVGDHLIADSRESKLLISEEAVKVSYAQLGKVKA